MYVIIGCEQNVQYMLLRDFLELLSAKLKIQKLLNIKLEAWDEDIDSSSRINMSS